MRLMGLDFGDRRIGVAVSDEMGMIARGVTTILRKGKRQDMETICRLAADYGVETVVVGYPIRLDGTEGIQCEKVNRFIRDLTPRLPVPVVRWDETLSTKEAESYLREAGAGRKKKKILVDQVAAGVILQGYLDARAAGR